MSATNNSQTTILIRDYVEGVQSTDRFAKTDLRPILLGLFGEVGSVMSTAKKLKREQEAYAGYRHAVEEEFGDTLWYFTALCSRFNLNVEDIFSAATKNGKYTTSVAANELLTSPISEVSTAIELAPIDDTLLALGRAAAALLDSVPADPGAREKLIVFSDRYLQALQSAGISFAAVARANLAKTRGRFLSPDYSRLPTFDEAFPADERIPDEFEIVIKERRSGQSCLQWNGVFIGDPLTDNIRDPDGYRFHDVFHFSHAAILHWSPTFRALIKHKRKSDPSVDEAQDSGRAIVVEEGLSAWIFSRAKQLNFFADHQTISFDLLKTISQFVSGYEVESCPLRLWEEAILQGYGVFRQVRINNGGVISASRTKRRIDYRPLSRE